MDNSLRSYGWLLEGRQEKMLNLEINHEIIEKELYKSHTINSSV